jgi:outer membrane protein assembly factor BamB
VIWQNRDTSCRELVGLYDLGGDASRELIVRSTDRVHVLRLSDGALLWSEPAGEMGTIGGVRVGDLDADGTSDIVIQECGCCAVNSNNTGFAYSFSGAGATLEKPQKIWALPDATCGSFQSATLVRMLDGDRVGYLYGNNDEIQLLDGKTGVRVATTGPMGKQLRSSACQEVNPDGQGLHEALCVISSPSAPGDDGHRMFMLRHDTGSGKLTIDWLTWVGAQNAVTRPASMVVDLDADGLLEIVIGGRDSQDEPVTYIYDLATGSQLASMKAHQVLGTAPVLVAGKSAVITRFEEALYGLRFTRSQGLEALWSIDGHDLIHQVDLAASARSYTRYRLLTAEHAGHPAPALVMVSVPLGEQLELLAGDTSSPSILAAYQAPADTTIVTAWSFPTPAGPRLFAAQTDGNLHQFDSNMMPLSGDPQLGASFVGFYSQAQFRQLMNTPVVADLGDAVPGVLLTTSRGTVVRIDAREATFTQPPVAMWSRSGSRNPVILPGLVGGAAPGVALVQRTIQGEDRVVALRGDGSELWVHPLGGHVLTDLVFGNFDGDGYPDLFVQYAKSQNLLEYQRAISGKDGSVLWELVYGPYNRQPSGAAIADWNDDGYDDVIFQVNRTYVVDGKLGVQMHKSPNYDFAYSMPTVHDANLDNIDEISLYARYFGARTLSHDLQSLLWQSTLDERPYTYATVLRCGGDYPQLVGGSWAFPSRLLMATTGGPNAGAYQHRVLAAGQVFANEAEAELAGVSPGKLASPVLHPNLAGDGSATILVGSSDGWLYGLDACSQKLRFAQDFGASVGSIVFGDTNADGKDEILVSCEDGHLYAMKERYVLPVDEVRDVDPSAPDPDADVDVLVTHSSLHASWPAAPLAEYYEVAVVRAAIDGGGLLTEWRDVGAETRASLDSLPLEDGKLYHLAVRANAYDLVSPEVLSDGVRVQFPEPPPPGEDELPPDPKAATAKRAGRVLLVGRSCLYFCGYAPGEGRGAEAGWCLLLMAWLLRRGRRATALGR